MPALWIAHVTVTDEEAYGKYAKLAGPAIAKAGGEFIARGGRFVQLEGKERPRNVVATFPSVEAAVECYHSPEYQEALSHARDASEREPWRSGAHFSKLKDPPTRRGGRVRIDGDPTGESGGVDDKTNVADDFRIRRAILPHQDRPAREFRCKRNGARISTRTDRLPE